VLGSGGITGIAWELGILAGLVECGVDLGEADLVVGTSAGAVVGAAADYPLRYRFELAERGPERPARMRPGALARFVLAMVSTPQPERFRVKVGRLALSAKVESEASRKRTVAGWLPDEPRWPDNLVVTAVDASSGEHRRFDARSGVPLLDAVAASTAVPGIRPPITIGGRRYVDGGMRSPTNADLAQGHDVVVVLAPDAGGGPIARPEDEVATLAASGRAVLVRPDTEARAALGKSIAAKLDPSRRKAAALAGYAQAASEADRILAIWGRQVRP